jgi:tRNA(Ile)-lysidine synthase
MCSGGPDSMALLDIMYNKGYEIYVAHVNYQKRISAIRDQNIVVEYCQSRNIYYKILKPDFNHQSNFQAWAREIRYQFAIEMANEKNCEVIMVAHQLDDVLETYLMQKKRGSVPNYYGIKESMNFKDSLINRPLLDKTKKDLENYCLENGISYGVDESNLSDDYQRNRIRHQIIDNMSKEVKLKMIDEINELNKEKQKKEQDYISIVNSNKFCSIELFKGIDDKELFLRLFIDKGLSSDYISEVTKQLLDSEKIQIEFKDKLLVKEYSIFYLMDKTIEYSFTLNSLEYIKNEYFEVTNTGNNFEALTVSDSDFPITIRNYQKGDKILMRYGTKKLSRWFIDKKILTFQRKNWPVVCDKNGEIILVPEIGCNLKHYSNNPTFYVVQYGIN